MASCGKYLLFLTLINIAVCDFGFVNVNCNPGHGQFGHQSLLECIVSLSEEAKSVKITKVYWYNDQLGPETLLINYASSDHSSQPRFTLAEPNWTGTNLNVSMLVNNTMITDIGSYTCTVLTVSSRASASTNLSVSAPYSTPTIGKTDKNNQKAVMTLSCNASGGYPSGGIHWFDEHKTDWTTSSKQHAIKTKDGRFSLTSELDLLSGSIYSKYTCVVFNSSRGREGEAQFNVPASLLSTKHEESKVASKIVIGVVLIGAVVIGLLMVKILQTYRRRSHRTSASYSVCRENARQDDENDKDQAGFQQVEQVFGSEKQETLG
ncbi:hypothetical protein NHX12_017717 [Muraenolepis orangiensis]|uniref:Ig-like domain-containing protein n=1 Tax=Muraenolepis orangiensis TaxID=630683 RepID=A0A9Q0IYB4_9TELE|nr:hypothetical protein NHX12_017717 [Muraenolepis orangiensis]